MTEAKNSIIWSLRDDVSAKARILNNQLDSIGVRSKGASGLLGKLGNVTGGLITPMSLGASGALALGAGIVAAGRAAIDEEKNIAKLDASLRANVAGWDGNTDAIESQIKTRQKLAFSDDELRESLALLLGATKDVGKAQTIQATAMDLARLKGISLKEASESLIKVEAGQFRVLKSLGIVLRDGATQTEALAAVQKVAGGQAKAYGETTAGAMEAAQIAIDDVVEDIGELLLPVMKDVAMLVRDVVAPAISDGVAAIKQMEGAFDILGVTVAMLTGGPLAASQAALKLQTDEFDKAAETAKELEEAMFDGGREQRRGQAIMDATKASATGVGRQFRYLAGRATAAASDVVLSTGKMRDGVRSLEEAFVASAKKIIGDYYGPIQLRQERLTLDREASEARQVIASKDSTAAQIADAKTRLTEIKKRQAELLIELGATGDLTIGELDTAIAEWQKKSAKASEKERERIRATIRQYVLLKLAILAAASAYSNTGLIKPGDDNRVHGGPVEPGKTYNIGEQGPEKLVMGQTGGYVIPNTAGHETQGSVSLADAMPRGAPAYTYAPVLIPLLIDGREIARVADQNLFYRHVTSPR